MIPRDVMKYAVAISGLVAVLGIMSNADVAYQFSSDGTDGASGSFVAGPLGDASALYQPIWSPSNPSGNQATARGRVAAFQIPADVRPKNVIDKLSGKTDPGGDDWESEKLSSGASQQLKVLAHLLNQHDRPDIGEIEPLVDPAFSSGPLRPGALEVVYRDTQFVVERPVSDLAAPSSVTYEGAAGVREALADWLTPLPSEASRQVHVKVFQFEERSNHPDDGHSSFDTRAFVDVACYEKDHSVQQNSIWRCRWANGSAELPRLLTIEVEAFEQVTVIAPEGRLFLDCTESVLARNVAYRRHLLPGNNHWLTRLPTMLDLGISGSHGLAVGDVNGDGLEDLYLCDLGGLPNRLFVQNPDGTLTDTSAQSGVDFLEASAAAVFVDFDNDGDQDLAIATLPAHLFAANDGQGRFEVVASLRLATSPGSICAADYDNDGDVDLYTCASAASALSGSLPAPVPYYDANNGGANTLLRNDGDFQFTDVTDEAGLGVNNTRFSLAAAWEDYDNDGDQDLYVANDFGRNCLYRNDGNTFVDVANELQVEDHAAGMSVSWGDVDRNGRMDVYIGNMFSAAGERVTYQRRTLDAHGEAVTGYMQRMARGNTLFANLGDDGFRDISVPAAVTMGRWAWASKFGDLNNDGWEDIVVANGNITNEDTGDL